MSDNEEADREPSARTHKQKKCSDRKSNRQRHAGGKRRAGLRSRRRKGRRRNRKNRRRSQSRARTQEPNFGAGNRTGEVSGDGGENRAVGCARDSDGEVSASQGTRTLGEHTVGGEMLADSPKNTPHDSFIEESNAIATTSQDAVTRNSTHRPGHRRRGKKRRKRRRRKGKKSRSKERERKMRRREKKRKRKEKRRRRLQLKKRRKMRERRKGE